MYILGYLHTPHRAHNRRKAFVCHCICGTCWRRALSKTNSCIAKQHGQLASVSEVRGCFWLRNLVGAGEEGTKGIRCTLQGADFWSSFSPHFPGPPPDVHFSDIFTTSPASGTDLQHGVCEGNGTKALQTRDIPNCRFTKFKHLNFKNSYLLFICGTVS